MVRLGVLLTLAACSYEPGFVPPEPDTPPPPDAFSVASCPSGYMALPGATSRYRVIVNPGKAWIHSDACTADLEGATHLVAIDDVPELRLVESAVTSTGNIAQNKAWVGAVQPRMQGGVDVGWISATGEPIAPGTLWDNNEPNDGGQIEDNGENFAAIERNRMGLVDFNTNDDYGAMCECDGKPLAPAALAAINENRTQ